MIHNEPVPTAEPKPQPKNFKNIIIAALAIALAGLGGYVLYDKSNTSAKMSEQQESINAAVAEKSDVQTSFDASLSRLDSMATVNTGLNTQLAEKNNEISKIKEEIRDILKKENATAAELSKAKSLINKLNGKITNLQEEVARLTADNQRLGEELTTSNIAREELSNKVDIASTLNVSNFSITPVNVKRNGKEKVSSTAKRVDKMIVSFDVSNRIVQTGSTDLYVIVIGPDGQQVTTTAYESGQFTTREEGEKSFTAKVPVELETARTKKVSFPFTPGTTFQRGNYTIKIYQNGYLIGEGTQALKKGGLFG